MPFMICGINAYRTGRSSVSAGIFVIFLSAPIHDQQRPDAEGAGNVLLMQKPSLGLL